MKIRMLLVGLLWLATPLSAQFRMAVQERGIDLAVEGSVVTAGGVSPRGDALLFVAWSKRFGPIGSQQARIWRVAEADEAGDVRIELPYDVVDAAIYVLADVKTGRLAILKAPTARFNSIAFQPGRFTRDANGEIEKVLSPDARAAVVLVRPNVGAWIHLAADGGPADNDGTVNGTIVTLPETMQRIAGHAPAPRRIGPHDVVFVADPGAGTMAMVEVAQ